jgi:hypothetical protein
MNKKRVLMREDKIIKIITERLPPLRNSVKAVHSKVGRFLALKMITMAKTKFIYKSAITGRIVRKATAVRHPKTTIKQRVKVG